MILEEIKFENFRCFYGSQSIALATDPKKNVTLIHAQNGVGKTTILNAVLWAMFGITTSRFEQKDWLLNDEAEKEGASAAQVEVTFEHKGESYLVKRFYQPRKPPNDRTTFKVFKINEGNYEPVLAPETLINSVIPRDMAAHFFFDGEHAETFSGEMNSKLVGGAIRNILGCNLVETAIEDMQSAEQFFNKQIRGSPNDQKMAELERQRDSLEMQVTVSEAELVKAERELKSLTHQIEQIITKLRDAAGAKEIQKRRDELQRQLNYEGKAARAIQSDIVGWIGKRGTQAVSKRITAETFDFLDELTKKGTIPSPYNEKFVQDILERQKCICGRDLEPGSKFASAVMQLLKKAGNVELENRVTRVRARLRLLKEGRKDAPDELARLKAKHRLSYDRITKLEQKVGECGEQLKGIPFKEIAKREEAREILDEKRSKLERDMGRITVGIEDSRRTLKGIQNDIDAAAGQSRHARILIKRRDLAKRAADYLDKKLETEENSARGVLQSMVNEVLEETARKDLTSKISKDFTIRLESSEGVALPKSGGENQLLSLAFTAALVNFARVRANAKHPLLLPGTIAPLVLDSPFGQLDDVYKTKTAEFVPEMANQVLLLVTRSQGDDSVIDALSDKIGREYVVIRENRAPRGRKTDDVFHLHNKQYTRTLYSCERNLCRIEEVKHG